MSTVVVRSDASTVAVSLRGFALSLGARDQLMRIIGLTQLESVRRTFREGGSPAGSWMPLSPVSLQWRKYKNGGQGHRLLIDKGLLLNSITFAPQGDSVVIGTGLRYAEVHQYGFNGTQAVRPYTYTRRQRSRDQFRTEQITDKAGRNRRVKRKTASGVATVSVSGFSRHVRIPARPFLVFRPEDPARIQRVVEDYVARAAKQAGLETN